MDLHRAVDDWTTLLGPSKVLLGDRAMAAYGADTNGGNRRLPAALRVDDVDTLPELMRIAQRWRVAVYPLSTGRNWGYGSSLPASDDCVIIDLSGLRRILHFDAELGVVTVEPGVTQGQLAEFLDRGGHPYMVPVTGAGPTCSLLGNALERGYGITPHTDHFGAVTDLEAVLPDGSRYRSALREAGGEDVARLFKWGIGPYSAGLFTQSGFGIVTRMSILLARRPESVMACLFSLRDDALLEPAVERVRDLLRALPGTVGAVNLMNQHRVLAMSAPFPRDQLGPDGLIPPAVLALMGRQFQVLPWTGFATLYGTRRMVRAAQAEMRSRLRGVASRIVFVSPRRARALAALATRWPGAAGQRLARTAQTLAQSLELVGGSPNETALPLAYWRLEQPPKGPWRDPARDGCGLIWYAPLVPMRPNDVRAYTDMAHEVTRRHRMEPLMTLTSLGDKLFDSTVPLLFDRNDSTALNDARNCYDELFSSGRRLGCLPYRLSSDGMDKLRGIQSDSRSFHENLRRSIDPHRLLMPGRYD